MTQSGFLAKHCSLYISPFINNQGLQNYSHDIMSDYFIGRMAEVLKDYDNSLFSDDDDYKVLASYGVYDLDEDELENDCVKGIIKELQEKDDHYFVIPELGTEVSHLSQIILDLFDNSSNLSLIFKIDDLGAVNARTNPNVLAGNYTITLDDTYVKNGTQLAIARTIIHESVHAWLSYLNQGPPSDLKTELLTYLQNNGYDYEDAQHMLMSDYAPALASSIAAWDNHQLAGSSNIDEFNYYNALSFSGEMLNSTAFSQLSSSEQQMVLDANKNEGNATNASTNNAKGSKCP